MSFNFEKLISRHFDSDEVSEIKKLSDYSVDKLLFERLQVDDMITDLSDRILGEIKDKTKSIGERYRLFIEQLKQKSKQNPEKQIVPVKDNLSTSERFVKKAEDEFIESLGKKSFFGPILVGLFDWVKDAENIPEETSMWDRFWIGVKGSIGESILGKFGFKKLKKKISDFFAGDFKKEDKEEKKFVTSEPEKKALEEFREAKEKVKLDETYYKIGLETILYLPSTESVSIIQNEGFLLEKLRYYKFSEIDNFEFNYDNNGSLGRSYGSSLEFLKKRLKDSKVKTLLRGTLTTKLLKRTIKPDNKKINTRLINLFDVKDFDGKKTIKSGKERLEEIYKSLEDGSFRIKDLYLNEIGIFYMESFPSFGGLQLDALANFGTDLYSRITGQNVDKIKKSIKQKSEETIPLTLIRGFSNYKETKNPLTFGGNEPIKRENDGRIKEKVLLEIDKLEVEDSERLKGKQKLEEIIVFKNKLLTKEFFGTKRFFFTPLYKGHFVSQLNYLDVITLYSIANGEDNLTEMPLTNLAAFLYKISKIIERGDSALGNKYLWDIISISFLDIIDSESPFNDEEQEIINIYLKKVGYEMIILIFYKKFGELGGLSGINKKYLLSLGSLGTGGLILKIAKINPYFRSFGFFIGILGVLSGIYKAYIDTSNKIKETNLGKDFNSLLDLISKGPNEISIEELREMEKKVKNITDSIHKKKITINGEEKDVVFVDYAEDERFIYYDNSIWTIEVSDEIDFLGISGEIIKTSAGNINMNSFLAKLAEGSEGSKYWEKAENFFKENFTDGKVMIPDRYILLGNLDGKSVVFQELCKIPQKEN